MRALIIGASGFVGKHLYGELKKAGWDVGGTKLPAETWPYEDPCYVLDILNEQEISSVLQQFIPEYIFLLAAQSSVALSWKNPALTVDINVKGTVNVLESARKYNLKTRILTIGSCEEYGAVSAKQNPVKEETPTKPGNIYAASKLAQEQLGLIYAQAYQMDIIGIRAFNHFGPGQSPVFVMSDFCKQVAEIEAGLKEPVLKVGNLDAERDFTDVRDVARAYRLLAEYGKAGKVYNVGSGCAVRIKDLLAIILSHAKAPVKVMVDPAKRRPTDVPKFVADISRIQQDVQWSVDISHEQTIIETLDYWREYIRNHEKRK